MEEVVPVSEVEFLCHSQAGKTDVVVTVQSTRPAIEVTGIKATARWI